MCNSPDAHGIDLFDGKADLLPAGHLACPHRRALPRGRGKTLMKRDRRNFHKCHIRVFIRDASSIDDLAYFRAIRAYSIS